MVRYVDVSLVLSTVLLSQFSNILFDVKDKLWRKIVTFAIGLILGGIYYTTGVPIDKLLPSFCVAITLYDYCLTYIFKKLKVDYNSINDTEKPDRPDSEGSE
jgi:hypothetical protein